MSSSRRGMPQRIRKKNKFYFDEEVITSPSKSKSPKRASKNNTPKKLPTFVQNNVGLSSEETSLQKSSSTSSSSIITSPDKKIAQNNGYRLRNFLKLPQAHKWVYYEWFYSNLDKPLFEGENDFQIVLKEAFPQLMTKQLTRRQWGLIRKIMGKPRRCSHAFFDEERQSLEKRRQVLRLLQQRKLTDISNLKDLPLPPLIPMQLVVGTKVTARLRKPENGLYTGIIDAVDTSNNTYRISFDRNGIGTHSIADFETLSNEKAEMMPLSSFSHQFRPRLLPFGAVMMTPPRAQQPRPIVTKPDPDSLDNLGSPGSLENDPILAQSPIKPLKLSLDDDIGDYNYPVKSLVQIVSLSKILTAKKEKIDMLRELNSQAEHMRSFGQEVTLDFQRKYASLVLEMENINRDLNDTLVTVQQFCQSIAPDIGETGPTLLPSQIKDRCYEESAAIVDVTNHSTGSAQVTSPAILDLITKFTSIMLQLKNISESEVSAFELNSLQESVNEIRESIDDSNSLNFQNNVEVHISHIMSAVSQVGTLQAFNS